jgi:hypothetical protein
MKNGPPPRDLALDEWVEKYEVPVTDATVSLLVFKTNQ